MLINHEITYYTGVRALVPRCPPFQRSWGSVPVLNPRSGIPGYNHFAPPPRKYQLGAALVAKQSKVTICGLVEDHANASFF